MAEVKMPGMPAVQRVAVYIDGFNLYYGIRDSGLGRYLWLDLCKFSRGLLREGQELVAVRYFTSPIRSTDDCKRKRQLAYLDALRTLDSRLLSIAYGNFKVFPFTCYGCLRDCDVPTEKQTDVNIAVTMVTDAVLDRFDVALLVSGDSDLCPAVSAVRTLSPQKLVVVCFPPERWSKELVSVCSGSMTIGRGKLSACQFPDTIVAATGFELKKPALWDSDDYRDRYR